MEPYLLFFDIDGTLRDDVTGEVSDETKEAVLKARKNGHFAFLNTGRSFAELDPEIMGVGFDGAVCGCGTYVDFRGRNLLRKDILGEEAERITNLLEKCNIEAILEGPEHFYVSNKTRNEKLLVVKEYFGEKVNEKCRFWQDETPTFQKFSIWLNEDSDFETLHQELKEEFDFIKRADDFYEVIPMGHSKATGMDCVGKHLGIKQKHMVAMGDSTNDLSMLDFAGVSVAMGNSAESIKKRVDFVTKSVEEDGVAYALEHFGFISA